MIWGSVFTSLHVLNMFKRFKPQIGVPETRALSAAASSSNVTELRRQALLRRPSAPPIQALSTNPARTWSGKGCFHLAGGGSQQMQMVRDISDGLVRI